MSGALPAQPSHFDALFEQPFRWGDPDGDTAEYQQVVAEMPKRHERPEVNKEETPKLGEAVSA